MADILDGLNEKQKEAVQIISGPVLVLSGPGSGKTKVLTHRIAYLIENGIGPENILAVTFTNKAADEMKQRIVKLLNCSIANLPAVGTFHAICAQILRREAQKIGYKPDFTIYDESDQLSLVKKSIEELEIDPKQFNPRRIAGTISGLKSELTDPESYSEEAADCFPKILSKIYTLYQKKLRENNAFDFDDLIMKAVEIFRQSPEILGKYQNKFGHILVDEYQDINTSQFILLKLLAQNHRNIFVIGDDAQNIYSFRGADFRNILNFERDWPEAKVVILGENYRSHQNILDAAYGIISKSPNFREKKLWTEKGEGEPLEIKEVEDAEAEGEYVANEIKNQNRKYNDFVALYRTNAQSRAIEEAFLNAEIPYKIIGGIKFYERKEVKDILAWLRLCQNPNDSVSLERITKLPRIEVKIQNSKVKTTTQKSKLETANFLIEDFSEKSKVYSLTELMGYILSETNYANYLRDGTEEGEGRWENIGELLTVASKYNDSEPPLGLQKFLEEIALIADQDQVEDKKDVVYLMTFHSSKGLEFPVVFILGCEEGIFPHSKSLNSASALDEERRLCYVAITRARERVYLVFAKQRRLFGMTHANPPSRFLEDIPGHLVKMDISEDEA